jgi:hypothetical protein
MSRSFSDAGRLRGSSAPCLSISTALSLSLLASLDFDFPSLRIASLFKKHRPFSEEELRANAPQVISCNDQRREVTVNLNVASKQIDRTFTFDKVRAENFAFLLSFLHFFFIPSLSAAPFVPLYSNEDIWR